MAGLGKSAGCDSKARARDLPSVDRLLRVLATEALLREYGHSLVAAEARALLDGLRIQTLAGVLDAFAVGGPALVSALAQRVAARLAPRMRRVLNLSGTECRARRVAVSDEPVGQSGLVAARCCCWWPRSIC